MNNNRNNNRRRGRGNRQQGGGNPVNRIDSRARGNAPQMLDKYKKLAQDAQHNGDRVQAEYYLQFADHYFRVIADTRQRQEEGRTRHNDQRPRASQDDYDSDDDMGERDSWNQDRQPRGRANGRDYSHDRQDHAPQRQDREEERGEREQTEAKDNAAEVEVGRAAEAEARPRRGRQPRERDTSAPRAQRTRRPRGEEGAGEIDAAVLPPAFKVGTEEDVVSDKPAPRRRRKVTEDDEAAVSAVG